jgi:hypothetical protein
VLLQAADSGLGAQLCARNWITLNGIFCRKVVPGEQLAHGNSLRKAPAGDHANEEGCISSAVAAVEIGVKEEREVYDEAF